MPALEKRERLDTIAKIGYSLIALGIKVAALGMAIDLVTLGFTFGSGTAIASAVGVIIAAAGSVAIVYSGCKSYVSKKLNQLDEQSTQEETVMNTTDITKGLNKRPSIEEKSQLSSNNNLPYQPVYIPQDTECQTTQNEATSVYIHQNTEFQTTQNEATPVYIPDFHRSQPQQPTASVTAQASAASNDKKETSFLSNLFSFSWLTTDNNKQKPHTPTDSSLRQSRNSMC